MSYVLPLIAFEGNNGKVLGTCVLLSSYFAITAKHVVEGIYKYFNFDFQKDQAINLDLYIPQFNSDCVWYVSQVFAWSGTDIAFLKLHPRNKLAEEFTAQLIRVTVDTPAVGTEITALGYPNSEIIINRNDSEVTDLKLAVNPTVSTGHVLDIYHPKRDSSKSGNFPCFSVETKFARGMSGGAVFNDRKELCGVICRGGDGGLENYSIVADIWPSMIIKMKFNSADYLPKGLEAHKEYSILELARSGYLNISGNEKIEFFKHENGSDGVRRKHY